jgi:hypothetical protein
LLRHWLMLLLRHPDGRGADPQRCPQLHGRLRPTALCLV